MRKRRYGAVILAAAVFAAGCAGMGERESTKTTEETYQNETGFPVTVIDHAGREVVIESEPQTIVSGYYISTSLLIALEQENKLVGVENNAEKRPIYKSSAPEILELPGMGTVKEFDLEQCAALNPDLVILPSKLTGILPSLEELGITALIVNPENEQLLEEMVAMVGAAVGNEERAAALNAFADEKTKELEEALEGTDHPSVYITSNSDLLRTAGPAMYQHTLLVNGGGDNVAEELTDTYWAEISYEQLLAWNPEYIILAADADFGTETVLKDIALAECSAVVNEQVYQLPNKIESWDSPVPGCVLGQLWLASVLHPMEYTAESYETAVKEFYETFYGFTP